MSISVDITKTHIIGELFAIQREGKDELIKFLQESDFFTAPASTKFHDADDGGLALHSWTVYRLLKHKNKFLELGLPDDTIRITGLLHDLCKIDTYVLGKKWVKNENTGWKWTEEPTWKVVDQKPYGHGEKSVIILQKYIELTHAEILMVRWHMGSWEPGVLFPYPTGFSFSKATELCPGIIAISCADQEARIKTQ